MPQLEIIGSFSTAKKNILLNLKAHHNLIRSDNTMMVAYNSHQGGLGSPSLHILAHHLLLWTQGKLLSLRAVHVLGRLNQGADMLSWDNVSA